MEFLIGVLRMSESKTTTQYETVKKMSLNHLPDKSELIIQKQTGGKIPKNAVQFGLPFTFVNPNNNQTVWNNGPSIQLEQIPELIKMLDYAYEKYSEKAKTCTFADVTDD